MTHLEIIEILDLIITSETGKLQAETLANLVSLREHFKRSKTLEERIKLGADFLKYLVLFHELFK